MNRLFDILASLVVVAGVTTLVLPGRQSAAVINAGGNAFSGAIKAATGR
jgi:hypothetical protein